MVLTLFFTAEMVVKILGMGLRRYAKDQMNIFDAFIVILSLIEFAILTIGDTGGGGTISVFRAFRLMRLFKLARSWTNLRNLLISIVNTLKALAPFLVLVILFMFIASLLSMETFAHKIKIHDGSILPFYKDAIVP